MSELDPERWRTIDALLDRVLDAPPSERERILDEACAGDAALRGEVERMIVACEKAGERFDEPPLLLAREVLREPEEAEQVAIGQRIGPWRITELLGRGGMGAVYRAERADGAFEKTVALKIVKRGMDTDEIIRRFHQERQILARLEHPNIAGLIDGGVTDDGMPYFVMELAIGEPIDEWCDARTLLLRERLQLFRTVCEAVQYAHGNLIVHRDLKPANVVVSDGEVKLLDFGIAKLLGAQDSQAVVTQAREMRLTPRYAAPEQVKGEATTTATDVYSLGVILYELLTGRPPYRLSGRTLLEMEVIICNEDAMRPSLAVTRLREGESAGEIARRRGIGRPESLQQQLRGDLDAICLKALRKAPEERYVSPVALADDVERFLDGQPVRAVPPSRRYRVKKFVQRNYAAVLLGSITAIILVVATVTTAVMAGEARRQSALRLQEAERATVARDFMVGTLGSFDPDERPDQQEFTARDLVERGVENLSGLELQPELKATVMNTLGQVAFNLGERNVADSLFRTAIGMLERQPDGPDLANAIMGLGQILQRDQRYGDAAALYRRALQMRQRVLEPTDRHIAEAQQALAFAVYNLGTDSAFTESERLYRDLLEKPALPSDLRAAAIEGLADIRLEHRQDAAAESLYIEVLNLRSETQPDGHPDVARSLWGLATSVRNQGRLEEAEADYRRSLAILLTAYGPEHRDVAFAHFFLARILARRELGRQAAEEFVKAAETSASVNTPGHPFTASAWLEAGGMFETVHDGARALVAFGKARQTGIAGLAEGRDTTSANELIFSSDMGLGRAMIDGQPSEATRYLREAWTIAKQTEARQEAATLLAVAYDKLGRRDSASWFRDSRRE